MTEIEKNARMFKAFGDTNRLTILRLLQSGERCACDLLEELHIGQPTLSHHLKILCDAGIVQGRKEGKWIYYSFDSEGMQKVKDLLEQLISSSLTETKNACL